MIFSIAPLPAIWRDLPEESESVLLMSRSRRKITSRKETQNSSIRRRAHELTLSILNPPPSFPRRSTTNSDLDEQIFAETCSQEIHAAAAHQPASNQAGGNESGNQRRAEAHLSLPSSRSFSGCFLVSSAQQPSTYPVYSTFRGLLYSAPLDVACPAEGAVANGKGRQKGRRGSERSPRKLYPLDLSKLFFGLVGRDTAAWTSTLRLYLPVYTSFYAAAFTAKEQRPSLPFSLPFHPPSPVLFRRTDTNRS